MATCWDNFTALDWPRYAGYGGKVTTVTCIAIGIVGCFIGKLIGIQIWSIVCGFLIAILELPVIYRCIEPCRRLHNQLVDELQFKRGWVRGVLYIGFSAVCFVGGTISVMPGVFLDLTAILYFFASISEYQDELDRKALRPQGQGPYQPVDQQPNQFGTFSA